MRSLKVVVTGMVAVVALSASCSHQVTAGAGPLQMGGDSGELCMQADGARDLTFGFDAVSNSSPEPVTLGSVSLVDARGLRLVAARIFPVEHTTTIGVWARWPPVNAEATAVWARGVEARGARVLQRDGDRNLVLHLVATSDEAGFDAVRVRYRVGNREFVGRTSTRFRVKPSCTPSGRD